MEYLKKFPKKALYNKWENLTVSKEIISFEHDYSINITIYIQRTSYRRRSPKKCPSQIKVYNVMVRIES